MSSPYPGTMRPLWAVADWLERPRATVRTWYRRGQIEPKACHIPTRALLFDMRDAAALAARSDVRSLTSRAS